jgi:predicted enzyme related to lactoylglutathione lyase/ketosteroid isomerase-like protein
MKQSFIGGRRIRGFFLLLSTLYLSQTVNARTLSKETVSAFVAAINEHSADKIQRLLAPDPAFIDAQGHKVQGADKMKQGWEGYFQWFPDYKIEVSDMSGEGDVLLLSGFAEGSYHGNKDAHWRLPTAWKAEVKEGKVALWQVYCDTKVPFDIIAKFSQPQAAPSDKKVTGIGGVFFKCKDPETLKAWYKEHLGLNTNKYGTTFEWRQADDANKKGFTQWSAFKETTKYFEPSTKDFMLNYRVADLEGLVAQLKKDGVTVTDEIASYDYGKFVHIMDPEGNKIELWEPVDEEYDKIKGEVTK